MLMLTIATSFWSEHVVTTIEEPKPIKGRADLAIVSCILFFPTKFVEVLVVIVSIQVEELEKLITPKFVPLAITEIGVGVEDTLINIVTHACKVFRTLDTVLMDTCVTKRAWSKLVPLVEPVDTISEQPIDDLIIGVEYVVLGD